MNKYIQDALFIYIEKYNQLYNWCQNNYLKILETCTHGKLVVTNSWIYGIDSFNNPGLSSAHLINKHCITCCLHGLTNAPSICTAYYSCGLASASLISKRCTTSYLCGMRHATLLCTFNTIYLISNCKI